MTKGIYLAVGNNRLQASIDNLNRTGQVDFVQIIIHSNLKSFYINLDFRLNSLIQRRIFNSFQNKHWKIGINIVKFEMASNILRCS